MEAIDEFKEKIIIYHHQKSLDGDTIYTIYKYNIRVYNMYLYTSNI